MTDPLALRDQRVLVTGAASGIGLAAARFLARSGARLVLADADGDALSDAERELEATEAHVQAVRVDVAFKRPVLLPGSVAFGSTQVEGGYAFSLTSPKSGAPHLAGRTTAL